LDPTTDEYAALNIDVWTFQELDQAV